jgi:hypothetical protein
MDWKKLLGSIAASVNNALRLRNDYLLAENRILRQQIPGRVQLTDKDRKELAEIGAELGKKALAEIATVATPNTILAWHRKFADQKVSGPRVDKEIEDLVVRMARENHSWGYDRIQDALKHLGYTISEQTVGHILKRHGILPAPERQKMVTWRGFVRIHLDVLVATDFFNGEMWRGFGLMISSFLWVIHFVQRRTHTVVRGLHHHRPGQRSFVMPSLDVSAHGYRWMPVVKNRLRCQKLRCGQAMLEMTVSSLVPCDVGQPRSHHGGQGVVLSNVYPKPIHNGPMCSRRPRGDLFRGIECKAA